MFDPVVIAYDTASMDVGLAVRAALELFRLHVYAHFLVQKRNAVDFFAGKIPDSEYVVLCSHGSSAEGATANMPEEPPEKMGMGFVRLVDQINGKWEETEFALSPSNIRQYVKLAGRTVVALGCGNGREPLAREFLKAGCRAYIGAISPPDQDATALFAIGFFYHLLSQDRPGSLCCNEAEAVRRAAEIDKVCKEGTHIFRYYSQQEEAVVR